MYVVNGFIKLGFKSLGATCTTSAVEVKHLGQGSYLVIGDMQDIVCGGMCNGHGVEGKGGMLKYPFMGFHH